MVLVNPKNLMWRKVKTCFIADENIPWPRYTTKNRHCKKKKKKNVMFLFFPDEFGVKEPRRSENSSDEKRCSLMPLS